MAMSWPEVRQVALDAEELGFEGYYVAEHLMGVAGFAEELGVLDGLTLLAALAPLTERLRLGALVSPVTFRPPPMVVRQIAALDVISDGRAVLGLGAGWSAEEHAAFGITFPAVGRRLDLLDDACRAAKALWESDEPVHLDGAFPLCGACLRPPPVQHQVPLLVAGASQRSITSAARWAATWDCVGSPAYMAERTALLRRAEADAGRAPGSVLVTANVQYEIVDDRRRAEERRQAHRQRAVTSRRAQRRSWAEGEDPSAGLYVGPLDGLASYLEAYQSVGVDALILALPRPIELLQPLAEAVLG